MAYTLDISVSLGSGSTGLTLKAALRDYDGTLTAKDLTTIAEVAAGIYHFHSTAIPDSYRGLIVFYTGSIGVGTDFSGVTVKASAAINPQEVENADAKVSTRLASASYTAPDNSGISTAAAAAASAATSAASAATSAAAAATDTTTLLARIGAFTGTGLNTILGFFRALMRKTAALTPSDVGGTFDNTTDSNEAIRDSGAAGSFPENFGLLEIDADGRVRIQDKVMRATAIEGFEFLLVRSDDHRTPKDGLGSNVSASRSIDGGAFFSCANTPGEVGLGIYVIDLADEDLDGVSVTLRFTATGADTRYISLLTTP